MVFILEVLRGLTLPLLTDGLQSVLSIKRMELEMKKIEFLSQPIGFCYLNTHGLETNFNRLGYATIARSALPKSEFGAHASNKDPSLKHFVKNTYCVGDFCQ